MGSLSMPVATKMVLMHSLKQKESLSLLFCLMKREANILSTESLSHRMKRPCNALEESNTIEEVMDTLPYGDGSLVERMQPHYEEV